MAEAEATKEASKTTPEAAKNAPTSRKSTQNKLYAVFKTGGKQYRVKAGDKIKIEKLGDEYKEGDKISFDQVLLTDNGASDITLGTPFITDGEVKATLNKIGRYKTIDVIKYKQKSRYFKKYGHRQPYFEIQIDSIK